MSILADDPLLLPRLLVGLEAFSEQIKKAKADRGQSKMGSTNSYPSTLRIALNALAAHWIARGRGTFPSTLKGFLTLCAEPISEWFPADLPPKFPNQARLIYPGADIELSEWASYYLNEEIQYDDTIFNLADSAKVERALQNRLFTTILEDLRSAGDPLRAQAEYVLLRRFLISHPFVTTHQILSTFASTSIRPQDVGGLYTECYPGTEYYRCPNCGPLSFEHGRLRGAKPDVCSDHREGMNGNIDKVEYVNGLRKLHVAIHERVCLHGITEVRWLDAVRELQGIGANAIVGVEDWPGIDRYDMRVTFKDGTAWAADLKDYKDPERLAQELKPFGSMPDALRYDMAFYVIPDRREQADCNYFTRLLSQEPLPANHKVVTVTEFLALAKTHSRRRKRKDNIK